MTKAEHPEEPAAPVYVPAGMPALDLSGRVTSRFEFWPTWLVYLPVLLQWLLLAIRYRSLSLPLIANPAVPLSGMVGVPKSAVFEAAGEWARQFILPWLVYEVSSDSPTRQVQTVLPQLQGAGISLPVVGKPNVGCRGAGVKLLRDEQALADYLAAYPPGAAIQFQQLSRWEPEAGVFYVRDPATGRGQVTSLTLKYTPFVVGDGRRSLGELIAADPRAGQLQHLYSTRLQDQWQRVPDAGEPCQLLFSASHCRGAVFRDAAHLIDEKLSHFLDRFFDDVPGFYYGRLDLKFRDPEALAAGESLEIIEVNGASSESINIWDRDASLTAAVATLLRQYRALFRLGHHNRGLGHEPPGLVALYRAWRFEQQLVKNYPQND
jgi:hypothetical protein